MSSFTDPGRLGIFDKVLAACRVQGRATFVGYLLVGYPDIAGSCEAYRVLCEGTGMVEIGMPYSDPFPDGPVMQHATTRALARGVRTRDALTAAKTVTSCGRTSVVVICWNLIEQHGPDAFVRDLVAAGGASVITPDLTPDEADEWIATTDAHGLDRIFLIAPSSTPKRIAVTMAACQGWMYTTSIMGVTGVRRGTSLAVPAIAAHAWEIDPRLPVGAGMGVGDGDQVAEVGTYADAVVVGSTLMRCLANNGAGIPGDLEKLGALAAELPEGARRSRWPDGHSCGRSTGARAR